MAGEGFGLSARITLRIVSDGRAGHEAQTRGLAEALGLTPQIQRVAPRGPFDWLAPFGPADPQDAAAWAAPFPDIALAAGRRTIPALRRLKSLSRGKTFTVYLNKPASGLRTADVIVAPRHDALAGPNVVAPLTPAHRVTAERLAAARAAPDPRVAALPGPRVALLIGGDSRHVRFDAAETAHIATIARVLRDSGVSVMATASRRTPAPLRDALRELLLRPNGFFWANEGDNPYFSMLALADALIVTGDSVNMISEAAATDAPVYVVAPRESGAKISRFIAALEERGAIQPWRSQVEYGRRKAFNATPAIAQAVADAYRRFLGET